MTNQDKSKFSSKSEAFDKKPLQDKIGSSLRRLYDDVLDEDVPDDFLNLLKQADDKSDRTSK